MESNKLGPCPLCGRQGVRFGTWISCPDPNCGINVGLFEDGEWSQLSALAAQNKRRGEALEKAMAMLTDIEYYASFDGNIQKKAYYAAELCEEALK